jgi:hypothetical protein
MARIYKRSDRIAVKIDDIVVKLAPLTLEQKTDVQIAMLKGHKNTDIREASRGLALAIQYSLKGVEGLEDGDGNPYTLKFDANDVLTTECLDDLMNLELTSKLAMVCSEMIKGVPSKFTDPSGKELEGVELVKTPKAVEGKNQA